MYCFKMQKNIYELNHLLIIFKTFMYELAAEFTIIVHFLFIVFVVIGFSFMSYKNKITNYSSYFL